MTRPSPLVIVLAGALLLTVVVAAWLFWPQPAAVAPDPPPQAVTPTPEPPPPPQALAPAPEAASAPEGEAPLPDTDQAVSQALTDLLGQAAVLGLLQTDGFAARVVATVDNLPRNHVAPRVWPVNPIAGRFSVDADQRIAEANARRYDAAVQLLSQVSPAQAAQLLRRMAPAMQAAYEQLGYPGKRFDARLREVLDHLLATPTISRPPVVTLTDVQGPIKSERPWVRYEFEDTRLQALSAGQRMLLRIGPAHQRTVLAWLRELRALL